MKRGLAIGLICLCPVSTSAAEKSIFKWHTDFRTQYLAEENRDLGTKDDDPGQAVTLDARLKLDYRPHHNIRSFLDVSAVKSFGDDRQTEDVTGTERPSDDYLELRQAWLRFDRVFNNRPLQFQLGRQRIREDYALWWNDDLDAARAIYSGKSFKGFIGVAENLGSYRTSHDMTEDKRNILHVMGEASFVLDNDHRLELRTLYEDDHSGIEDAGEQVDYADYDREDGKIGWAGLRFAGTQPVVKGLKYRLDALLAGGDIEEIETLGEIVIGADKESILGFAVDGAVEIPIEDRGSFLLGYAYGSKEFRQSEIYGNSSRMGYSTSSIHHYGEAFRPELSNIHVLTAGWSMPVNENDLTLLYHYYRLDDADEGLQKSRINADTGSGDADLGHEIDAVMNIDLDRQIPALGRLPGDKNIRFSMGVFKAGDAFVEASGELSYRALAEFRLRY